MNEQNELKSYGFTTGFNSQGNRRDVFGARDDGEYVLRSEHNEAIDSWRQSHGELASRFIKAESAAKEAIEAKEAEIATLKTLVPPTGDGSCDHCGRIPSFHVPTNLCDECNDGIKRAEAAESRLSGVREVLNKIADYMSWKKCGDSTEWVGSEHVTAREFALETLNLLAAKEQG